LFKELQNGWEPPLVVSEEDYKLIQHNKLNYPDHLVGYVGFQLSYGGKWFGGYRRDSIGKRNYSTEAYNNTVKQMRDIKDIKFVNRDYLSFDKSKIKNCMIYCDPPYEDTTKYTTGDFDYETYWNWVRELSINNYVLVSEYNAPDDFICIWEKNITTGLKVEKHEDRTEKLFTYKNGLYDRYNTALLNESAY
jgi:DNA adenine methylase